MPTITLPIDHFGTAVARAGLAVLQRGANAQVTILGTGVAGYLSDEPAELTLASAAVNSRRKRMLCAGADVPAGAVVGTPVTLDGAAWQVAEIGPAMRWTGWVAITLERA